MVPFCCTCVTMVRFKLPQALWSVLAVSCVVVQTSAPSLGCISSCACSSTTVVLCRPQLTSFPSLPPSTTSISLAGSLNNQNSIPTLTRSVLSSFPDLEQLVMTYSGVTSLENDVFQSVPKLTRIDLKNNRIAHINSRMFQGLTKLFELDLTNNAGCTIAGSTFHQLVSLRFLYLGDLNLGHVDGIMLSGLKKLKGLDLHGNDIADLSAEVFDGIQNLETLDISYNNISSLSDSLTLRFKKMISIQFYANPWRCTCDLKWFKQLKEADVYSTDTGNVPVCLTPNRLKYHPIYHLSDRDLTCIPPKIVDCGGPYDVTEGDEIRITCQVEGDLFPDITWRRPDGSTILVPTIPFSHPRYQTVRNVHVPPHSATIADSGDWTIIAVNDKAKDTDSIRVNVEVLSSSSTSTPTSSTSSPTSTSASTTAAANMTGLLIAAGGFGGTVLIGLIVFFSVVCCAKKNRVHPNERRWMHDKSADEITFVVAPVSE